MLQFFKNLFSRKTQTDNRHVDVYQQIDDLQKANIEKRASGEVATSIDYDYKRNLDYDNADLKEVKGLAFILDERNWQDSTPRFKVKIPHNTTNEVVRTFLETLPRRFAFGFSKFNQPKWTRAGEFLQIQHYQDSYISITGGHGWSGEWTPLTTDQLIEFIIENATVGIDSFQIFRATIIGRPGKRIANV